MNDGPLYGRSYAAFADPNLRQLAFANALMRNGASTEPVRTPIEGVARALQGGIGGYFANQAQKGIQARDQAKADAIARALQAGQGQTNLPGPNPDGSAGYNIPPDMSKMAAILAGNPDTASMALPLAVQDMQYQQGRADKLADVASQQGFQKDMAKTQFDYQQAAQQLQFAQQNAMQDKSIGAQQALQQAQQNFAQAQMQAQQAFQGGENEKNRAQQLTVAQMNRVPGGFVQTPTGYEPIPGGPADPKYLTERATAAAGGKMTDEQSKAAGFADRVQSAMPVVFPTDKDGKPLPSAGTNFWENAKNSVPGVGNYMTSPEYQKFDQAKRDIVNAILRRESGAAISQSEFDNAEKQYFPRPGDSPEVVAQKKQNMMLALQSLQRSAGSGYKPPQAPSMPPSTGSGNHPAPPAGFQVLP